MDTLVEELAARAKTLSQQDRARLVDELLASLQGEPDADADASWTDEIGRRVAEIQSGSANLTTTEEVHAQARRLYQR